MFSRNLMYLCMSCDDSHVRTCTPLACVAVQTCLFRSFENFVFSECLHNSVASHFERLFFGNHLKKNKDSYCAATCVVRRIMDCGAGVHLTGSPKCWHSSDWRHALGTNTWQFALPSASDNTAARARAEKLWSAAEPLGGFLKLGWAARRHIELLVTHLAGEYSTLADELSRGNKSRFRNLMTARHRIPLQVLFGPNRMHHATLSRGRMAGRLGSRTTAFMKKDLAA